MTTRFDTTAERNARINARTEDGEGTSIPIDMFTPSQRRWLGARGVTVGLWYGQPSFTWKRPQCGGELRDWWIGLDTMGWRVSFAGTTQMIVRTMGDAFRGVVSWGALPPPDMAA